MEMLVVSGTIQSIHVSVYSCKASLPNQTCKDHTVHMRKAETCFLLESCIKDNDSLSPHALQKQANISPEAHINSIIRPLVTTIPAPQHTHLTKPPKPPPPCPSASGPNAPNANPSKPASAASKKTASATPPPSTSATSGTRWLRATA